MQHTGKSSRAGWRAWALSVIGVFGFLAVPAEANAQATLESIQAIRALSAESARQGIPVRLQATVTYCHPRLRGLFVHDAQYGIFVKVPESVTPHPPSYPKRGDLVEISAVTQTGEFGTVLGCTKIEDFDLKILGHPGLPSPNPVDGAKLLSPDSDGDWIAVEATVREVRMIAGDLVFECQTGFDSFDVILAGPLQPSKVPWYLADNRVRIQGVVATGSNANQQMTRRFLHVDSFEDIQSLDPAPNVTEQPKLVRVDDLLRINGPGPADFIRLRGISTSSIPGRGLFLRTEHGAVWAQMAQPLAAPPGSAVEVDGWPRAGSAKPFLRVRRAAVLGVGVPPLPIALAAQAAMHSRYDSELVSVDADLLAVSRSEDDLVLELRDGGIIFRAILEGSEPDALAALQVGSRVRITGIARSGSTGSPHAMESASALMIRMRSASDAVLLIAPPFWTIQRVTAGAALVLVGMVGVYTIAKIRRNHERVTQRREFEAVLNERGRFAREIHDSLAQGLTSISLQLECVRDELRSAPDSALEHVEKARTLVRDSLREARHTVWNLRPLALGEADLGSALQHFAANLSSDGKVMYSQQIEGTPHPLAPDHEAALLRIGQESMTNAMRHANPTQIKVTLRFGPGWVTLSVRDNGTGFDVAAKARKGYGLTGMHERMAALGGSLSIDSQPGEGTEVAATFQT